MQQVRDHGAVLDRDQLRTPVSIADGVGFFQHQVLARFEARDRHGEGKAQQQGQQAQQGGLQRGNMRLGRVVGRLAQPAAKPEAQLDDRQEDDESDEEEIALVQIPEHAEPHE
ncbi:hypothetical protein D3C71_1419310 [compost metagenome]